MNSIEVKVERVSTLAFTAHFKTVRMGQWKCVNKNGKPAFFDTPELAEIAAWRAMRDYWQADIVGDNEGIKDSLIAANSAFKPSSKPVKIERRKARQLCR
ncbi:MAG: hypothetical protein U5K75_02955 [Ahrensia sp.]|nr:hypothetical protein [Ahrensia sp.]